MTGAMTRVESWGYTSAFANALSLASFPERFKL